jgi:hypothetical protein
MIVIPRSHSALSDPVHFMISRVREAAVFVVGPEGEIPEHAALRVAAMAAAQLAGVETLGDGHMSSLATPQATIDSMPKREQKRHWAELPAPL